MQLSDRTDLYSANLSFSVISGRFGDLNASAGYGRIYVQGGK